MKNSQQQEACSTPTDGTNHDFLLNVVESLPGVRPDRAAPLTSSSSSSFSSPEPPDADRCSRH